MLALNKNYLDELDEDEVEDDSFILDAKYKVTAAMEVANQQHHLSKEQKQKSTAALADAQTLFDGKLGHQKNNSFILILCRMFYLCTHALTLSPRS